MKTLFKTLSGSLLLVSVGLFYFLLVPNLLSSKDDVGVLAGIVVLTTTIVGLAAYAGKTLMKHLNE